MFKKTKAVSLEEKSYSDLRKKEEEKRSKIPTGPLAFQDHSASREREGHKIWKTNGDP